MACIATLCCTSSLFNDGPTAHWLGPETLVSLKIEEHEVNALADSASQVNTVTPGYMCQHEFPILPLGDLKDYPLNLIGLGGMRTRPLGFVILLVQISEIVGYDENVVFLIVPDVPLVIGMCILGIIVNVIKESEWDLLSTSWAMTWASCLLCHCGIAAPKTRDKGSASMDEGATMSVASSDQEIDELVFMKESLRLGPLLGPCSYLGNIDLFVFCLCLFCCFLGCCFSCNLVALGNAVLGM